MRQATQSQLEPPKVALEHFSIATSGDVQESATKILRECRDFCLPNAMRTPATARRVRADEHAQCRRVRKLLGQLAQSGGSDRHWTFGIRSAKVCARVAGGVSKIAVEHQGSSYCGMASARFVVGAADRREFDGSAGAIP